MFVTQVKSYTKGVTYDVMVSENISARVTRCLL